MPATLKDMMEAANAAVERINTDQAKTLLEHGGLLLDVRDAIEVQRTGRAADAHHIPRGMLEFRADDTLQSHDPEMRKDRAIVLYCASGGRSALAGKLLKDMGYERVYNLGGLTDWVSGGGDVVDS